MVGTTLHLIFGRWRRLIFVVAIVVVIIVDFIVVIIFAHIAEEILGLFLTPFWFLVDLFKKRLDDDGKAVDYITYVVELIFFAVGILVL